MSQLTKSKEDPISQDLSIEQEIECPRCHDVMTLCSEFDRLGYYCEECRQPLFYNVFFDLWVYRYWHLLMINDK